MVVLHIFGSPVQLVSCLFPGAQNFEVAVRFKKKKSIDPRIKGVLNLSPQIRHVLSHVR